MIGENIYKGIQSVHSQRKVDLLVSHLDLALWMWSVVSAAGRCLIRSPLTANKMTVFITPDQSEAPGPDRDPDGQQPGLNVGSK